MTESGWLPRKVPSDYTEPTPQGLSTFYVEVSWGGTWVNLNDKVRFRVGAESFADSTVNWRKQMANSPVAEGSYLVHAVKDMVTERLQIYVNGVDQNDLAENIAALEELISQLDYRIRITYDEYREYWRCQPADWSLSRGHTFTHNLMAVFELTVPRFPTVSRELVV